MGMHNTCEDSLLASPLILDLAIITELMQRIEVSTDGGETFEPTRHVLSILSYLLKAPVVSKGTPVVNALTARSSALKICCAPLLVFLRRTTCCLSASFVRQLDR